MRIQPCHHDAAPTQWFICSLEVAYIIGKVATMYQVVHDECSYAATLVLAGRANKSDLIIVRENCYRIVGTR